MKEKIQEIINSNFNKSYFDDRIFINHPGIDKHSIIREITSIFPEESFCFLNERKLREKTGFIQKNFLPNNPNKIVAYAVKANPKKRILEIFNSEGINSFDCASINEIAKVLDIEERLKILFNHPIKKKTDIKKSSEIGVNHFTAQSHSEIEKILENTGEKGVEIALRMQTLNKKAKVNLSEKFGNTPEEINEMMNFIKNTKAKIGISIHTGSQNENPNVFSDAIKKVSEVVNNRGISTINIGGGIPVDYEGKGIDIKKYFEVINKSIEKNFDKHTLNESRIIIELGRALVAEAIDLVIPILSLEKMGKEKVIHINEGVFTSFSDFAVHGWSYNFKTIKKNGKSSERFEQYKICGRTCDSGDNLGRIFLPENLEEGDLIWIEKAGAYMDSQSSYFNGFEPPKYVSYNY